MENQVYYIQALLANELGRYKDKENSYTDRYIKKMKWNTRQRSFPIQTLQYIVKIQQIQDTRTNICSKQSQ